jgi:beta-lactamase superfamily II metal-dependent hydrolase
MKTKLNILKAHHGDSMIIETYDSSKNKFTILIDGGPRETFRTTLVHELDRYKKIDLIILTHIDHDHISGLIQYLSSSHAKKHQFDKILLNAPNLLKVDTSGTQISIDEGIEFEKLILSKYPNLKIISDVTSESLINLDLPDGIDIKILSPNQDALDALKVNWPEFCLSEDEGTQIASEDFNAKDFNVDFKSLSSNIDVEKTIKTDFANASSIAFSIQTHDFHGLFLGDSHSTIVAEGLSNSYPNQNPIVFDYVKLSHHGSKYNISNRFLDNIECYNYIISTNGGKGVAKHPDRQTIAKIVRHMNMQKSKVQFYFNYPLSNIEIITGKLFKDEELVLFDCHDKNEFTI